MDEKILNPFRSDGNISYVIFEGPSGILLLNVKTDGKHIEKENQ